MLMVPRITKQAEQSHIRELHGRALSPDLTPKDSIDLLKRVRAGYDNDFDRARAVRDAAKYEFRLENPFWKRLLHSSLYLLNQARSEDTPHSEEEILREEAATHGMYGRLELSRSLESGVSSSFSLPLQHLKTAKAKLRKSAGRTIRPDQYEINFAAARVIAERYSHTPSRGFRALARTALISPISESRFARHNGNLPKEARRAARKRSLARTAFAAKIAFGRHKYVWSEETRHEAAELVA